MVERTSGERTIELGGVDAHQPGLESIVDEAPRQRGRLEPPQREHRLPPAAREKLLPIRADILEKQIAEGDVAAASSSSTSGPQSLVKGRLVIFVGAGGLEMDQVKRQADARRLGLEELAPDAVDADTVVAARDSRDEPNYAILRIGGPGLERN